MIPDPLQRSGEASRSTQGSSPPSAPSLFDSTSRQAGAVAAAASGSRRLQILQLLQEQPRAIFEIAEKMELFDHQISGRFGELEKDLLIEKTGERRVNPKTQCQAEVYRVRAATAAAAVKDLGDRLGYPQTLMLGDEGSFERIPVDRGETVPGLPYSRRAEAGGVRLLYRLALVECDGCGRPLKRVEETVGGKKVATWRCGTVGCGRVWHLMKVHAPGGPELLALVMKHL